MTKKNNKQTNTALSFMAFAVLLFQACTSTQKPDETALPIVSVITIDTISLTSYTSYSANLEGIANVEIRPQVEGYLEKSYVDEGAYVYKGQSLFRINDSSYDEHLNTTNAALLTAKVNVKKAQIEVSRLEPLVIAGIISPVQLDDAKASLDAEKAKVSQAEALQKGAVIKKDFTLIKAPVTGYIGRIPYKIGSLIGRNEPLPLTMLSDIHQMYAYFSMSETDFLKFKEKYDGISIEEKIRNIPAVTMVLADNSEYSKKGKVEMIQGQFDKSTASIAFRAVFPNPNELLRSGNTATILLPHQSVGVIKIPQSATFEIQNKVMAYALGDDNRIRNISLKIASKDETTYIISDGLKLGDRIVVKGLDQLSEDLLVNPVSE